MHTFAYANELAARLHFWEIPGAELVETHAGTRIRVPVFVEGDEGDEVHQSVWYATLLGTPAEPRMMNTPRHPQPRTVRVDAETLVYIALWIARVVTCVALAVLILWARKG